MIVKINNEEIDCISYEKTITNLILYKEEGIIEYNGINWDVVELPNDYIPLPNLQEQLSAVQDMINLIIKGDI